MQSTLIQAFKHVEVVGPHVIEGHFDLRKSYQILTLLKFVLRVEKSKIVS
jgi:hypothetical protein